MTGGVFGYSSVIIKRIRLIPSFFASLNSSPYMAVVGITGYAALFITGTAIPYTGTTAYNEGNSLGVLDSINLIDQGQTGVITNTGRSSIITQQQSTNCLISGNGLVLFMGSDLTGGDYGYDVTLFYQYVKTY